ncbi:hypothetical protein BDL97_11G045600 [Sphagnum fallax]|nr:hypothetical protein BDL97_11G045600 [Sphagnum fallax]KAH8947513.1 hypothetical protein BDL97_11G045600 [Sphagnum fallax]
MGMSAFYGSPKPEADMIELIKYAVNSGVTFLDTSDVYGPHTNEVLVGKVGAMKKLVGEGRVKHLGLSEASASDIRRAHAVQMEWSLWIRDLEEDIIPTCRELGIAIVPHSPLGRGFFAGYTVEGNKEGDMRGNLPRMSGENFEKNKVLQEQLELIAEKKKCSLN